MKLIQSLIMSRIACSLPFHQLDQRQQGGVNTIIRTAYKIALGLPIYTSIEKFYNLAICNTFQEVQEAALEAQRERLLKTRTGREILRRTGHTIHTEFVQTTELPPEQREALQILPIP